MAGYKKDQGRLARMSVFWTLTGLTFYGCSSMRGELAARFGALGKPLIPSMPEVPVLGVELSGAFLIALVTFVATVFFMHRYIEQPKTADLLIETESELRKVTWPTPKEVVNSSLVVIFSVLFLMAFLAGADVFLARVARVILFGAS